MWLDWSLRFLWLSFGSLIGRLLPYTILIWLGRNLDSQSFATVGVVFAWTTVAASLTTGGLANVAAQRLAGTDNTGEARIIIGHISKIGVVLSSLLMGAVLVVGPDMVASFFAQSITASAVAPALLSGTTWSLVMLVVGILNGMHATRKAASVISIGGTLQGVGLALGLWLGGGEIHDILWGFTGGNAFALGFALWQMRSLSILRNDLNRPIPTTHPIYLGSAITWATLATASVTPVTFAASAIISHGPDGALQLAQFHALEQLHQLATYLPNVMAVAMLPVLSRQTMKTGGVSVRSAVKVSWLMAGIGTTVALALAWNPMWLHRLVGNPALIDIAATRSMLMHVALYPSLSILGSTVLARGQFGPATMLNIAWASVLLGITWLRREEGAEAVQTARLIASGMLIVVISVYLWITCAGSNSDRNPVSNSTS